MDYPSIHHDANEATKALLEADDVAKLGKALTDMRPFVISGSTCISQALDLSLAAVGATQLRRQLFQALEEYQLTEETRDTAEQLLEYAESTGAGVRAVDMLEDCAGMEFVLVPCMVMRDPILAITGCDDAALQTHELRVQVPQAVKRIGPHLRSPIPFMMWPASLLLAEILLAVPELIEGKDVVELGCGAYGVPALAAASANAARVLATDAEAAAVEEVKKRLLQADESKTCNLQARVLLWEDAGCADARDKFPLIIGSDILHDRGHAPLLVAAMSQLLAPRGMAMIVNPAARHRFGVDEFVALVRDSPDIVAEVLPLTSDLTDHVRALGELDAANMDYELHLLALR